MPKDDWTLQREQRRPGDTGAYYLLSSDSRKITFSVYLEKTAVCQSAASCLDLSMKNPQYKEAKELEHADEGIFKLVSFRLSQPNGAPVEQANIQACAYVDGVWFDVHISKASKDRPDMAGLRDVLRQFSVK